MLHSKKIGEILRFGIVGVFATALQYAIYAGLLYLGLGAGLAFTISYALSWLCNFWLSAHFTFNKQATAKRGLGFAASHAVNWLLQVSCLRLFIWMGVPAYLAPLPVYCFCIPVNFILVRTVFRKL